MSNFRNLMQVFADSADLDDPFIVRARESILAPIRAQPELRFFVDGTANLGHQAATVHIMRRLIAMTQFRGRITLVYADIRPSDALGRTPDKLALLLEGLDIEREIRFLNYNRRTELSLEIGYGFTGGADDMNINFARELKVRRFLRLQPYLWDDHTSKKAERFYESSRIETPAGEYFYPVDDYPEFRGIPYKYDAAECSSVHEAVWKRYDSARMRDIYERHRRDESLVLWPVYGLHQFADRQARIVRDLVSIAAQVERQLPGRVELLLLNDEKIGPVPGEVFNYLYANSAMPGVFEGQNTSSLVISLGRPFLQLRRESSGIESPYPKKIGAREFADQAAAAETAALALRDGRPDEVVPFLLAARTPGSAIHNYFGELRRYYQQDIHDKLFAGLVALALSA